MIFFSATAFEIDKFILAFFIQTCFAREIILLYFILFISIQLCHILSNQGKYYKLNVIGSVHS